MRRHSRWSRPVLAGALGIALLGGASCGGDGETQSLAAAAPADSLLYAEAVLRPEGGVPGMTFEIGGVSPDPGP